ncbi:MULTISPECIES: hypothetical protein [unclassified Colwellia]|jgi:hypothetical protein|uniref:hypothetical protein n=1 Tax=unclassified Colwellia TaxID=196834 RepID=UPI0015F68106|nr:MULTISPECIES: hypothetical protein [unclassified Colwellia]MBA6356621.1 hypothetical protein [Colwellia sp. BRX8-3]MBA6361181.1 hypothetical protein [Colwellia sp. BRX8-6]MBA6368405.1 hypothetical protein [Colwellia sp. BRX8-5]MBA6375866.1 hypothetical protein [Colwellia sp. BRX8-2]
MNTSPLIPDISGVLKWFLTLPMIICLIFPVLKSEHETYFLFEALRFNPWLLVILFCIGCITMTCGHYKKQNSFYIVFAIVEFIVIVQVLKLLVDMLILDIATHGGNYWIASRVGYNKGERIFASFFGVGLPNRREEFSIIFGFYIITPLAIAYCLISIVQLYMCWAELKKRKAIS